MKSEKQDDKSLISVVVPVYNVEEYLDRCVKSIKEQTYGKLQIILVDDGSTDDSGYICDEMARNDNRIQVIHTSNYGLSHARNEGLEVATGDMIAFVDSDDCIHREMYERMYNAMKNEGSDIVACNIEYFSEGSDIEQTDLATTFINVEDPYIFECLYERDLITVVQWNKLFKREIFDDIRFPVGKLHEDVYVIHKELDKCSKVTYLDAKLYYYFQRENSIMHRESPKSIEDAIEGFESRIEFFNERGLNDEKDKTIKSLLVYIEWKINHVMIVEGCSDFCSRLLDRYREIYHKYNCKEIGININNEMVKNPQRYYRKLYLNHKIDTTKISVKNWIKQMCCK